MKHVLKPAFALFIIAAIVTAALSVAYNLTKKPIEEKARKTQEKAMKEVLPQADKFKNIFDIEKDKAEKSNSITKIYEGLKDGETAGYVILLAPEGYSGTISMMTGILKSENKISGVRILKHSETPGLGALAVLESFYSKYEGKEMSPIKVVKTSPGSDEIVAITGATITSKAVTNAVNEAIEWYENFQLKAAFLEFHEVVKKVLVETETEEQAGEE